MTRKECFAGGGRGGVKLSAPAPHFGDSSDHRRQKLSAPALTTGNHPLDTPW